MVAEHVSTAIHVLELRKHQLSDSYQTLSDHGLIALVKSVYHHFHRGFVLLKPTTVVLSYALGHVNWDFRLRTVLRFG